MTPYTCRIFTAQRRSVNKLCVSVVFFPHCGLRLRDLTNRGAGGLDVLGLVEWSHAEADGATGLECAEVSVGARGAMQAGADLDAEVFVEDRGGGVRVEIVERHANDANARRGIGRTGDFHTGHF